MKRSEPKVSICIPTYNGALHLRACLDSALGQKFRDHEVLVIDDGSTDATLEIVRQYASEDARLRLVRNADTQGIPGNWNRCLELARGTWVKFLFQDDALDPDCLQKMLTAAEGGQTLVAALRRFSFEAEVPTERRNWYLSHRTLDKIFPGDCLVTADEFCRIALDDPGLNILGEPSAMLLHHSALSRFGQFNTDLIMICDTEYWARIASHDGLAYVPEELVTFRVHGASASSVNLDHRQYRVALDGLVLLHEMLFTPVYEPLRRSARLRTRFSGLMDSLRERSEEAWRWAQTARSSSEEPGDSLLGEWSAICRKYPRIHQIATGERLEQAGTERWDVAGSHR